MPPDFDRQTEMRRVAAKCVPRLLTDALLIHEFLMKHEATVVPQPPYSPDLAPADFFLFPKLEPSLKGRRFQAVEEREENSLWDLRAIPQNTFQDALQNWKNIGSSVSRVEGSILKETSLIKL